MCVCVYVRAWAMWLFIQEHNSETGPLLLTQMKGNFYQGEIPAYL